MATLSLPKKGRWGRFVINDEPERLTWTVERKRRRPRLPSGAPVPHGPFALVPLFLRVVRGPFLSDETMRHLGWYAKHVDAAGGEAWFGPWRTLDEARANADAVARAVGAAAETLRIAA